MHLSRFIGETSNTQELKPYILNCPKSIEMEKMKKNSTIGKFYKAQFSDMAISAAFPCHPLPKSRNT